MRNKKFILLSFLFLCCLAAGAQQFGAIYTGISQKDVEKDLDKEILAGKENNKITFSSKSMSGDTLVYSVRNNKECFSIKLTFQQADTALNEKVCDYQEYIFDCPACSQKHLKDMTRTYKFRQKSGNVYLSSYFNKLEMTIQQQPENTDRLVLQFRAVDLPKNEYNRLYKTLKKSK